MPPPLLRGGSIYDGPTEDILALEPLHFPIGCDSHDRYGKLDIPRAGGAPIWLGSPTSISTEVVFAKPLWKSANCLTAGGPFVFPRTIGPLIFALVDGLVIIPDHGNGSRDAKLVDRRDGLAGGAVTVSFAGPRCGSVVLTATPSGASARTSKKRARRRMTTILAETRWSSCV
jgi:hypothetical protein